MMSLDEKCRVLDEIDAAPAERLREALRKVLCHYNARAAWAEEHFFDLKPRELGEACVALEVCELLAGGLSPCAQSGCDRASFFCKIHEQASKPVVRVQYSTRISESDLRIDQRNR
jgi:hypothetical protein